MLLIVQPLFRNVVVNCQVLQPLHSDSFLIEILTTLLNGVKSWRACLIQHQIRVIFTVRLEKQKVDKKQTYMETNQSVSWKVSKVKSIITV